MKKIINKIFMFLTAKEYRFYILNKFGLYNNLSDEEFLQKMYFSRYGKFIDFNSLKTFNEKLQWLKLYDHNPRYIDMVDKVNVKSIVADIIGEKYIIPTLKVYDSAAQIDFSELPVQCVLKCNHDSGSVFFVDENTDKEKIRRKLSKSLKKNYFWHDREWPYYEITPKILVEEYLGELKNHNINDYKVFTFGGKAEYIQVDYDRFINHRRNFYNLEWEYVPFTTRYPTDSKHIIKKPECLREMIEAAEKIADYLNNPKFLRVDFYVIDDKLLFGETTFYHGGGMEVFMPAEYDIKLGELIKL